MRPPRPDLPPTILEFTLKTTPSACRCCAGRLPGAISRISRAAPLSSDALRELLKTESAPSPPTPTGNGRAAGCMNTGLKTGIEILETLRDPHLQKSRRCPSPRRSARAANDPGSRRGGD